MRQNHLHPSKPYGAGATSNNPTENKQRRTLAHAAVAIGVLLGAAGGWQMTKLSAQPAAGLPSADAPVQLSLQECLRLTERLLNNVDEAASDYVGYRNRHHFTEDAARINIHRQLALASSQLEQIDELHTQERVTLPPEIEARVLAAHQRCDALVQHFAETTPSVSDLALK